MPLHSDPRREPGSHVYALAIRVTSEAECARRYGTSKKTKHLPGRVLEVEIDRSTGRANCFLIIDFDLGGGLNKRKRLNIRSVKAGVPPNENHRELEGAFNNRRPLSTSLSIPEVVPGQEEDCTYSTVERQSNTGSARPSIEQSIHGTVWEAPVDNEDQNSVGGPLPRRSFGIRTVAGEVIGADGDYSHRTAIDYFLMLFPPQQLREMVILTNRELYKLQLSETSPGEVLKFIGILMLCTRYEFGERRTLWSREPPSKYLPAPNFGKTGMSRSRFDSIFRFVRFSEQPEQRGELSSEQYRWRLVEGFVTRFNEHRESYVIPSELLCVDESISRWYGQGGDWINHGLPMYVAIDRKPENGCEIQNSACGVSGVMLRLKLVRTAQEENAHLRENKDGLLHGTAVLKQLVFPWSFTGRVVCADSYFASVTAARELKRMGLRFIGVVKTATKQFPMASLGSIETTERGESHCLVEKLDGKIELMAMLWVDRERRYFILSASSRSPGAPNNRKRWHQVDETPNAAPERVELTVPQPEAAEICYSACAKIDRHNRCRQADLCLEKKIGTLDWSMRVNMSILGMCIVDSWLAYKTCNGTRCFKTQRNSITSL